MANSSAFFGIGSNSTITPIDISKWSGSFQSSPAGTIQIDEGLNSPISDSTPIFTPGSFLNTSTFFGDPTAPNVETSLNETSPQTGPYIWDYTN